MLVVGDIGGRRKIKDTSKFKTIPAQIQNKVWRGKQQKEMLFEEIPLTQTKQQNDNIPLLNLAAVEAILS